MGEVADLSLQPLKEGMVECELCEDVFDKSEYPGVLDFSNFVCEQCEVYCRALEDIARSKEFLDEVEEAVKYTREYLRDLEREICQGKELTYDDYSIGEVRPNVILDVCDIAGYPIHADSVVFHDWCEG